MSWLLIPFQRLDILRFGVVPDSSKTRNDNAENNYKLDLSRCTHIKKGRLASKIHHCDRTGAGRSGAVSWPMPPKEWSSRTTFGAHLTFTDNSVQRLSVYYWPREIPRATHATRREKTSDFVLHTRQNEELWHNSTHTEQRHENLAISATHPLSVVFVRNHPRKSRATAWRIWVPSQLDFSVLRSRKACVSASSSHCTKRERRNSSSSCSASMLYHCDVKK